MINCLQTQYIELDLYSTTKYSENRWSGCYCIFGSQMGRMVQIHHGPATVSQQLSCILQKNSSSNGHGVYCYGKPLASIYKRTPSIYRQWSC